MSNFKPNPKPGLVLEGYAIYWDDPDNRFTRGAVQDAIADFLKAPIVTLNYDRTRIAGKCFQAQADDMGLFVKIILFDRELSVGGAIKEQNEHGITSFDLLEIAILPTR